MKKRVFSGIQPTGSIHIGNYLGAMRHWVATQDEHDNIFCIVDLHSITVPMDEKELHAKIREVTGLLLSVGIDPEKSDLFVQSHIPEHAELTWILNCITPIGWLQRMTQFKDKSAKQELVNAGLFTYPVLMAADILLYDTDAVPVGDDQKQHVEFTRDIAGRFNSIYGEVFKIPEPVIPGVGARIMGLDDPTRKMSKSEEGQGHTIDLLDLPDVILKKIKRATTDSLRDISFDEKRPGINNLLVIYEAFSGMKRSEIEAHFTGKGYSELKNELAEVVIEGLKPVQERYRELTADPSHIDSLLKTGAEKVRPTAQRILKKVKNKMGLG